jgi:hypothetical protein
MNKYEFVDHYFTCCFEESLNRTLLPYDHASRYVNDVYNSLLTSIEHIYSNFVVGVGFGVTSNIISYANAEISKYFNLPIRELWLLDSFEGLPIIDNSYDSQTQWEAGLFKGKDPSKILEICSKHIPAKMVKILDGWFSDTIIKIPINKKFSLLHIDCDLYKSAITVLEYFFQNKMISKGGVIVFDDWNCNQADQNLGERKAWSEILRKFNVQYSDWGYYGAFGYRLIIHDIKDIV